LVAAIFGGDVTFDNLTFSVNGTPVPYGAFLTALFTFVVVAFILFLVVKAYNAWKKSAEATVKTCPFCATDIPLTATRCPHCTSELQAA
jgi:large conductance mechanosensitive channel